MRKVSDDFLCKVAEYVDNANALIMKQASLLDTLTEEKRQLNEKVATLTRLNKEAQEAKEVKVKKELTATPTESFGKLAEEKSSINNNISKADKVLYERLGLI